MQGVPKQKILDDVRDSVAPNRTSSLIERGDLLNVIRDFSINSAEQRHADDATSVHMSAEEMRDKGDVFFTKHRVKVTTRLRFGLKTSVCHHDDVAGRLTHLPDAVCHKWFKSMHG